ncbi:hypothetical protein OQZ33_07045 [Pedobacter sp. MC2016-05]|uniref:hypothetical protein n=1 Tax=Pedobacter sp. MC2016-05 TaxID=2994474 RepID=UPI002246EA3C|nr:hypothetical protein [Pedobacter sp. MC2016-05]MCX2474081.1 hypothetical protein [Pedobacter sp. MC2016-05]
MAGNLNSASRASQFQNQIDQIGSLGTSVDEFIYDLSPVEIVVGDFIESVKKSIQEADLPVTGAIEDLSMSIEDNKITIFGNEHLIYTDRGVRGMESSALAPDSPHTYSEEGGHPPVNVFVEWINRKNINLTNNEFFYGNPSPFQDIENQNDLIQKAAWGMAINRQKYGVAPVPVFSKHIPKLLEDVKTILKTSVKANIISTIRNRYGQDVYNKKK